ncbi:MAG: cytochrome c biogenesis protein ResB [Oscillospiraceae bacterium]|nr:cytochrome c biogenesis protein ResB [Oscillospiraceae bacterium]
MKKLLNVLRSMPFGIVLLILIAALSVVGSVIPQERTAAWYAEAYPNWHTLLLALRLDRVFTSWFFLTLLALLCLNLTLCSLLRALSVFRGPQVLIEGCAKLKSSVPLTPEGVVRLEQHLQSTGCRMTDCGGARVWHKRLYGRFGSFLTHLAILLTILVGAAALYLPQVVDLDCMPGESVALPAKNGGTARFAVDSFRVTDENGRLDYTSALTVTLPDGRSKSGEISVNHPLSFGSYKVYQQSYGTAGSITVTNLDNNGSDTFLLTDLSFLSLDNVDGLWYVALYPDYIVTASGERMPAASAGGGYPRPIYHVQLAENGEQTLRFLIPGDTVEVGQLRFTFNEPVNYPGLRIKITPTAVNALLVVCFALMLLGLTLLFFLPPVLVRVDGEGYAVGGAKSEGTRLELKALLKDCEREGSA